MLVQRMAKVEYGVEHYAETKVTQTSKKLLKLTRLVQGLVF